MPMLAGAEPYHHDGGPVGVLLCHGFTSTPQPLRPWAEFLAAAGLTVSLPRLPGHGTTWQELARTDWRDWYAEVDRAFEELRGHCEQIFAMGLSLGGCLALRLAEVRGSAVAGLVLVNPSLVPDTKLFYLAPIMKLLVPSLKGISNDIRKQGVTELAYDRVPVKAAASLPHLWAATRAGLPKVTQPILVYHSAEDHVVSPASLRVLREKVGSRDLAVRVLAHSYHVATLDNDAEEILTGSLEFVRVHAEPDHELRGDRPA